MVKVHREEWKGRNRFFLNGKYMTGSSKDNITLLVSCCGMITFFILYSVSISQYLIDKTNIFFSLLGYFFFFTSNYYMVKTTFTDPGVIPRGNLEAPEETVQTAIEVDQENFYSATPLDKLRDSPENSTERILDVSAKKQENQANISLYKYRFCTTCKIMRPPKASHCSDCDNCVQSFDHHCFFVGNCVGRRNHKFFFLFLFYAALFCIYTTVVALVGFISVISEHPQLALGLRNQLEYWIISGSLILSALTCCQARACAGVKYTFIALGLILATIGFIIAGVGVDLPFYESPAMFVGYIVVLSPFALWIISSFGGNLWGVSVGLTFKEKVVIEREVLDYGRRQGMFQITLSERIANIKEFFARKEVESHIHGVH